MRHADRATSIDGADINPVAKSLITASVHNKQIRHYQDESEGTHTVSSLRYASKDKRRPDRKHYSEFTDQYPEIDIETYLKILGFDEKNETLQFQLDSWRRIAESLKTAFTTDTDQGVVLSADTGFGKTAAFSGEIFHQIASDEHEATDAIFVYPSRALLRDQLGTALQRAVTVGGLDGYTQPSLGVWSGDIPYNRYKVLNFDKNDITNERTAPGAPGREISIISHWDDSLNDSRLYVGEAETNEHLPYYSKDETDYRIFTAGGSTELSSEDLVLHKSGYRHITNNNDRPQVLFTTLESLENIALKPHYNIATDADLFVFDEIHQYTGLRGSHAAQIINNVQWVRKEAEDSQSGVFIGSSATVAEPQQFGQELFGIDDESNITTVSPAPVDIDHDNDDKQHFYFMLTPDGEEAPGVASQYIQQSLLTGQSLLKDSETDSKSKLLTFIDSVSQVNRLTQQTADAQRKGLPRKHTNIDNGDWETAADLAGRTYEEFKQPVGVYAGSKTSLAEIQEADVVNSTSFLEIGVDIDDLEFIGQYRSPRNLTNFKQRAGRGGRNKRSDAHIQVFLSAQAGDENFYYRADRFLEGDIHTPLNDDNDVVNWIHDRFKAVYRSINSVYDEVDSDWHKERHESSVFRNLFIEELEYERFWTYLDDPGKIITELTDIDGITGAQIYKDESKVEHIRSVIKNKKQEAVAELRRKSQMIVDTSENGTDEVPMAATKKIRDLREELYAFADTAEKLSSENNDIVKDDIAEVRKTLDNLGEASFESKLEQLSVANNTLGKLRFDLRGELADDENSRLYSASDIQSIEEAITFLESGELESVQIRRDILNHLLRSLEGIEDYLAVREYGVAHGSLFAFKGLLRSAYFLNKAYQLHEDEFEKEVRLGEAHRDDPDAKFWFVPDDYFDNAGKYFTLREAKTDDKNEQIVSQESVDSLLRKHVPFKTEYIEEGRVQAYCPPVQKDDVGPNKILVSEEATYEHKGIQTPEEIELTEIEDVSEQEADEIFPLDPSTYRPLNETEVERLDETPQYGKIMSRPDIRTTIEQKSTPAYEVGDLWVGAVDGTTRLNGVEMSITPYESTGNGNYGYDDDIDISDQYYEADSDFGFVLETTGVTWDLSDFISELLDQEETHPALESAREYKTFEDVSERESALATAAHFLTLTIADITGAGTQLLLYGIDKENDRVHVFDQTQGGQGIIELFYKEMERNPKAALDAVYRLIDNSQVLNDILWAQTTDSDTPNPWERILETIDVSVLSEEAESEARMEEIEKLKQITTETLKIDYEKSLERVAEEIASTTQRLHHFAEESNIEPVQFYELKHELARARQNGASPDEIPDDIISEFEAIFENENIKKQTIKSLLYPPDMDGCRANLHLNTSIVSDVDQEDVLSFAFLRALADHVVDRIDIDRRDKIAEQGRTWGRVIDDEVEYLSWGDDI